VSDLSERYEQHHRERRDEGDFVFVPERIPLLVAAVGRGHRVLDLGCRSGALTQHFLEGNSVVGLDVDTAALEKAGAPPKEEEAHHTEAKPVKKTQRASARCPSLGAALASRDRRCWYQRQT